MESNNLKQSAVDLTHNLNWISSPFYFKERVVGGKIIYDYYGKIPSCEYFLNEYSKSEGKSFEDLIPGFFVSKSLLLKFDRYVFSVKAEGLRKDDIRRKSDDDLIEFFRKRHNPLLIESYTNRINIGNIKIDAPIVGNVYIDDNIKFELAVFRITEHLDNNNYRIKILRSNNESLLGQELVQEFN